MCVWEYFCDHAYFDMWAVRAKGETRWGACYHMNSKQEAEGLSMQLTALYAVIANLEERDRILSALEAAGVDNWEGYSEAFRDLEDEEDED